MLATVQECKVGHGLLFAAFVLVFRRVSRAAIAELVCGFIMGACFRQGAAAAVGLVLLNGGALLSHASLLRDVEDGPQNHDLTAVHVADSSTPIL